VTVIALVVLAGTKRVTAVIGAYVAASAEVDRLLDKILDDYWLIVVGWSARWTRRSSLRLSGARASLRRTASLLAVIEAASGTADNCAPSTPPTLALLFEAVMHRRHGGTDPNGDLIRSDRDKSPID
jgi:hypothetical protein